MWSVPDDDWATNGDTTIECNYYQSIYDGLQYDTSTASKFDLLAEDDQYDGKDLTWYDKNDKQAGVDGVMEVNLEYLLEKGPRHKQAKDDKKDQKTKARQPPRLLKAAGGSISMARENNK